MNRKLLLRVVLIGCILGTALSAQSVFMGAADSSSSSLYGFRADTTLAGPTTLVGAPNLYLALPSGARYWVISKNSLGTVTVVDSSLTTVLKTFNLGSAPVAAALTPDGQKILVLTSTLRVFSTQTDTEIGTITGDLGFQPTDIAVSYDSRRAYVLSSGSQRVTTVDLLFSTVSGSPVSVPFGSTAISAGPNGEVYVSAPQSIYEYSQDLGSGGLSVRAAFSSFNGTPGKLMFTPDGLHAVAINQNLSTAGPALVFDLVSRTWVGQVPGIGSAFSRIVVPDNSRFYAVVSGSNRLYQCSVLSPGSIQEASFSSVGTFSGVQDIAISNEVSQARYMFLSSGNYLYRIELATGTISGQLLVSSSAGPLSWVPSSFTGTAPSAIIGYNTNQTLTGTTPALPLMVRVVDISGRPLGNVSVTFSTTLSNVNVTVPFVTTGIDGLAGSTVSVPSATGSYLVTATVNGTGLQTSFVLNVGGSGGGGTTTTGGLQVWSGTGQLVPPASSTSEPLTVRVADSSGNPLAGVAVTWYVSDQQNTSNGSLTTSSSTTDSSGFATANFNSGFVQSTGGFLGFGAGQPMGRTTITASTGTAAVNFTVLTLASMFDLPGFPPGGSPGFLSISIDKPLDYRLAAKAGETLTGAIQLHIVADGAFTPDGVGVRVFDPNDTTKNSYCNGGIVFTDTNGAAVCDFVAPAGIGVKNLVVRVASQSDYNVLLTVSPGDASALTNVQGDGQSGKPGTRLPTALSAIVTDAAGNPIPGANVTWSVVVPGAVTLSNVVSKSDSQGKVSAVATLGNTPGTAQVKLTVGNATYTFGLTVQVSIGSFTLVSGNNQTAALNTAFSQPLVVKVMDPQGNAIPNVSVSFTVASGAATVANPSATTGSDGTASTTVTAGGSAGAAVVQATVTGQSAISFNLTVRLPGPVFTAAQIVNAASFQAGVAPGTLVTIFGTGLAPGINGAVFGNSLGLGPLPTKVANVEVSFGSVLAPIFSVANVSGQESVTVQVPFELTPSTTTSVTIRVSGGSTTIDNVPVKRLNPGIFEMTDALNRRYAIILKGDGSFVSPENPAVRGEKLTLYTTGLGPLTPAAFTNRLGMADQNVVASIVVGINNAGNSGAYTATLSPTLVGLYELTFELDANAPSGASIPLSISAQDVDGTRVFSNSTKIAIR